MNQFFRKIVKECHFLAACALFLIVLIIKMFDNVAYSVLYNIFFFFCRLYMVSVILCALYALKKRRKMILVFPPILLIV